VKRRARITGALPEESMAVAAAGAGVGLESIASGSSSVELLGSRKTLSGFAAPENLKRAFLFFNRRKAGGFTVDDLHATLAELGHVDPPAPAPPQRTAGADAAAAGDEDAAGGGSAEGGGTVAPPPPPERAPTLGGISSPSRLKLPPSGTSPTRRGGGGPTVALVPAPPSSFTARAASDAAAMELAWELGMTAGGGVLAEPTLPFGHAAPPAFDPLAATLGAGARALVSALFHRLRGRGDPGNTGAPIRGFSLAVAPEDAVTFVHLVQWSAPLSKALVRMRQRVQAAFLASASTGGGGKDFEKAFRKVDENGDGVMSVAEFTRALGPLMQHLSPAELQELVDNFDVDGSGVSAGGLALGERAQPLVALY
jgi:Ca2+-binding EF-hand superfamily protein